MTHSPISLRIVLADQGDACALSASELAELFGTGCLFDTRIEARMIALPDTWKALDRVTLRSLCPVDSPSEKQSFAEGVRTAAQLSECYSALELNKRPVVSALAWATMSPVRQEWQFFDCFKAIHGRGGTRCTVYAETLTAPLEAAIMRVCALGLFEVEALYHLRDGQVRARNVPFDLEALRDEIGVAKRRSIAMTLPLPAEVDAHADTDADLPLITLHAAVSSASIEVAHTLRVIRAFEAAQTPYRLMSLAPVEGHAQSFAQAEGLQYAQVLSFERVDMAPIAARVNQMRDLLSTAALDLSPEAALTPHLMFANGSLFGIWRKNVSLFLTLQAALNKPTKSVWAGASVGVSNQALIECAGTVPVFVAPPASVSHHLRSTPYLDPLSHYMSYGTVVSDIYQQRGLAPETRVHHIGSLFCDPAPQAEQASVAPLNILLMSARMLPEFEDEWLVPLGKWVVENGHQLHIRRHPTRPGNYDAVMSMNCEGPGSIIFAADASPEACISAADLVVSDASTSSLISAIYRKPLVQVEAPELPFEYNDVSPFGASIKTHDTPSTLMAVAAIAENLAGGTGTWWAGYDKPDYDAFDQAFNAPGEGTPADRARDLLLDPPAAPRSMTPGTRLILKNIADGAPI